MSGPVLGTVIPTLRYRDCPAAIDWLCRAFGFQRHLIVPGDDGAVAHAQLTLGTGMIMVGSMRDDDYGRLIRMPGDDATVTQAPYIIVPEIDAHYQQAKEFGANIVTEIADQDHGGRLYSARDPEGHLWNFGSYDPWADTTETQTE